MTRIRLLGTAAAALLAAALLSPTAAAAATPLDAPTNLQAVHVSDTAADLWWNSSGLTAGDVVQRQVNGVWQQYATGLYGALALTGLHPGTRYTFRVYSIPVAGLGYTTSPPSSPISFTTLAGPDTVPPSTPPTPLVNSITTNALTVFWAEATDNVQVTGYLLEQWTGTGWTVLRTVAAGERFQRVAPLSPATSYTFAVAAFDARGNISALSAPVTATTLATTATMSCLLQLITYGVNSFQAVVTLSNTTTATVSGWSVTFTLPAAVTVGSVFNSVLTRTGTAATLTPAVYDVNIGPGGQLTVGFMGSGGFPSGFAANGVPCPVG